MRIQSHIVLGSILSVTNLSLTSNLFAAENPTPPASNAVDSTAAETHNIHDHRLIARIHMMNMHVIHISQLAVHQSESEDIKAFARKIIKEHLNLDQSLMSLAVQHDFYPGRIIANMDETTAIRQEHRDLMTRLGKLKSNAFDKSYLASIVRIHESEMQHIEATLVDIKEGDIRKFVDQMMTMAEEHLSLARTLLSQLTEMK
jgi:putative membrane protein